MEEYSIEWFKWNRDNHSKWLGTQALKLLEHYEQLEAKTKLLEIFEDKSTLEILQLIADDLWNSSTSHKDIRQARSNWLARFISTIKKSLEGEE